MQKNSAYSCAEPCKHDKVTAEKIELGWKQNCRVMVQVWRTRWRTDTEEGDGSMEVGKRSVIDIYRIWKKKGLLFSEMEIRKKFIWRTLHMHLFNYLLKCIFAYVHMCVCVYICLCVCVCEWMWAFFTFFLCVWFDNKICLQKRTLYLKRFTARNIKPVLGFSIQA